MSFDRIVLLRSSTALSGIDFIQVAANQTDIRIFFHHDTLPSTVRDALAILPTSAITILAEGQTTPENISVIQNINPLPTVDGRQVMHLRVANPGGFGYYRLRINSPVIDPYYNNLIFSFKANCPSELDCLTEEPVCPKEAAADFPVDYRARDFWSFRQALLDFATQRYPDWQDRLESDQGMVIVELLSALGDEFSYAQDRLAREAYLDSASQRRSLRHLTRWVDYAIDNGQGARLWLDITASANGNIVGGTGVTDAQSQVYFEIGAGLKDRAKNFAVALARNQWTPYSWDENETCLPIGASTLTLSGTHAVHFVPDANIDPIGKWVLLVTSPNDPALPVRRLAVRIIDARNVVDPLTLQATTQITWDQPTPYALDLETLVVRGNLVPATSGKTYTQRFRIGPAANPAEIDADLPLAIERVGVNSSLSYEYDEGRVKFLFSLPDSEKTPLVWFDETNDQTVAYAPTASRPEVELIREGDGSWSWLPSLVGEETAAATAKVFTLEDGLFKRVIGFERFGKLTELIDYASNEGMTLRFGDGEFGMAPTEGSKFTLRYRLGNGRLMNIAPDSLTRFESGMPGFVSAVTNPLPGRLGRDAETETQIRTNAPEAYRTITYRAVRPEDYVEIAERLTWVQQAGAQMRWTGSWSSVFVTPDSLDEASLSLAHRTDLEKLMDQVRQAGREVKVLDPIYANIDLEIRVCVAPNAYQGEVKEAVLQALFGSGLEQGFFDPDQFTFGTPLSRAALMACIQRVPGVKAVEGMRVRRRGWFNWRPFGEFSLPVRVNEIVRVTNDRSLPERGAVKLIMEGGA